MPLKTSFSTLFGPPLFAIFAFGLGCQSGKSGVNATSDSGFNPDTEDVVDLVVFDGWELLDAAEDPYPDHKTEDHTCDDRGILAEEDTLEINTNDCGYALVGQPLRAAVVDGDWIELMMYHSALASVEQPAEAHFSLWAGDRVVWERTMAIPSAAEVYWVPMISDWSAPEGTPVRLHLHNHGGNSWRLAYLKRMRGEAVPAGQPPLRGSEAPNASP